MKLLKYTLTIGALAFCCMANGQKSSGAAQFPELTPDVRGVGMGNTGTASGANAFSLWRNAAKNVFSGHQMQAGYSFTPWLRDLNSGNNLHAIAGYYKLDEKQSVHAGFRFFQHAKIDLEQGDFTPKDWSIDLGYARKLTEELSVGATARLVHSDMSAYDDDAVANAVAFDLGIYYRQALNWSEKSGWAVGLQAANFGTKIDYGYGKYDQPAKVSVGGMLTHTFADKHRVEGTLDIGCRVLPECNMEGGIGGEYTALDLVSVRAGYHWGEEDNKLQRYGTLGCGVGYHHIRADFAYLIPEKDSFLKNTWQISLSIDMGLFKK
jgi:hypothetical protein